MRLLRLLVVVVFAALSPDWPAVVLLSVVLAADAWEGREDDCEQDESEPAEQLSPRIGFQIYPSPEDEGDVDA